MLLGIGAGILACIIIYLIDRDNLFSGKEKREKERKEREEKHRQEMKKCKEEQKKHEEFLKGLEYYFGHKK